MQGRRQVFDAWMRDALVKLGRKIEDLEDVKFLMSVLQNVRPCPEPVSTNPGPDPVSKSWPYPCLTSTLTILVPMLLS